jgi:leader peptidase (prepilin peptidase)/N-methyltransferase
LSEIFLYFLYIFLFIFGTLVGSFLNVCIYRIPREESIVSPPSHCPNCSTPLKPFELIPLISFLILKGKCRYCKNPISLRYPFVELITGIIFVLIFKNYGISLKGLSFLIFSCSLIVIFFIDLSFQIIPDIITYPGILVGLILSPWTVGLKNSFSGFIIGISIFFLIAFIWKGGMGGGDIKMAGMMGSFLGIKSLIFALFLSFLFGSIIGIILAIFKFKTLKVYIPFGPFLVVGSFSLIFYGEKVLEFWNWYLKIFQ